MSEMQMKHVDDGVMIKNGAGTWMRPVFDDSTMKFYRSQKDAASDVGVAMSEISKYLSGEYKPQDQKWQGLRYATVEEVQKAFPEATEVNTPGARGGKKKNNKKTAKHKAKERVKIKVKTKNAKNTKNAKSTGKGHGGKRASGDVVMFRVVNGKVETFDALPRTWNGSTITPKKARGMKNWKEVAAVGDGKDADRLVSVSASFWAVGWPDGQITVRARSGSWSQTFSERGQVPSSILEASDVFELAR